MDYNYKVSINGQDYEFVLKNGRLFVLRNKDGNLSRLNYNMLNGTDKDLVLEAAIDSIIEASREEMEIKIQNGEYKNPLEIQKDLQKRIGMFDTGQMSSRLNEVNLTNNRSVNEAIKELTEEFKKQNDSLEDKKEVVKENIDVPLDTLFKEHGITEYEINAPATVVVYNVNGVYHTINNTNRNESIYDAILSHINLDKVTSKEEIDKAIDDIMELEADYRYSQNRNSSVNDLDDSAKKVASSLRNNYNVSDVQGQVLSAPLVNDSMVLADLNGSMTPVYISSEASDKTVTVGSERSIDQSRNVSTEIKDNRTQNLEEDLSNDNVIMRTREILIKCYQEEELTKEDEEFAELYRDEALFDSLPIEAQTQMLQIHDYIDNSKVNNLENENQQTLETQKVKKLEPPKEYKSQSTGIVAFILILTIIMSGIMVFTIEALV